MEHPGEGDRGGGPPTGSDDGDLWYRTLSDVSALIRACEISPLALTEVLLDRIDRLDGRLHSYATVMDDAALASAARAEHEIAAGDYRGPLHGVPVAVKDLCYTEGVRTMGGLAVRADFVPEFSSTVVERLEAAGAVILGKLNLTEGALGGYHRSFEAPVNPWGEDLWPGVSSSGSGVATAAGLCFAAIGTDTGGSVRWPSMANGVVGIKTTFGLVSRYGVMGLSGTFDTVGPLARSTHDAALVLAAIAGHDPLDPASADVRAPDLFGGVGQGVEGMRIGWDDEYCTDGVQPQIVEAMRQAVAVLEAGGAEIVDFDMPTIDDELLNAWFRIVGYEAARIHAATYPARAADYGVQFGGFLAGANEVTESEYADAIRAKERYAEKYAAAIAAVDVIASPAGGAPFEITEEYQYDRALVDTVHPDFQPASTFPVNFAGSPSITLPCGMSDAGWLIAMQFMAGRFDEPSLVAIGATYEEATDWHRLHPPV